MAGAATIAGRLPETASPQTRDEPGASTPGTARAVARGGTFVLAATLTWHASNFAFNALGARALGAGGYGQLAAVVALLYIVSPVLYALQASASGRIARLLSAGRAGDVRSVLARQTWYAVGFCTLAVAIVGLAAGQIAHALRLPASLAVLLLLASMPLAAAVNVQRGALQGIGRFERYAASTATEAVAKVALVTLLLILWPSVEGAVVAIAAALGCAAIANIRLLRALPAAAPTGAAVPRAIADGAVTLGCLVLLAVLLSSDVIAARHGMGSHASGVYAAVSLGGKVVFFATSGLTWVLFPMLSARDQHGDDGRRLLLGVLGGVAAVAAVVATVEWLAPWLVIVPLAGHGFAAAEPWLGPAACAFIPYALAYVLGMALAARRRRAALWVLAAATVVQITGFASLSPTIGHLLAVNACAFSLAAAGLGVLCLRSKAG